MISYSVSDEMISHRMAMQKIFKVITNTLSKFSKLLSPPNLDEPIWQSKNALKASFQPKLKVNFKFVGSRNCSPISIFLASSTLFYFISTRVKGNHFKSHHSQLFLTQNIPFYLKTPNLEKNRQLKKFFKMQTLKLRVLGRERRDDSIYFERKREIPLFQHLILHLPRVLHIQLMIQQYLLTPLLIWNWMPILLYLRNWTKKAPILNFMSQSILSHWFQPQFRMPRVFLLREEDSVELPTCVLGCDHSLPLRQ